ncbi:MAG: lipo-like protein [gamma proteobacterium symbiont of Bathyaustriella thionipta]|nr:lipo-like protein [gamma proteobacterium symbiont of Bathyaustriella thionipta]
MLAISRTFGRVLARYLDGRSGRYQFFSVSNTETLAATLQAGDVLLVEGNQRISVAIKYLTQSTWSHAALYVGNPEKLAVDSPEKHWLVEADLIIGVVCVPLSKYSGLNTRICRPQGLHPQEQRSLVQFALQRLGQAYDLKNVFDLLRYLLPEPPVPQRFRRRMLALGSGDPTRAICSTLIAQAFQSIHYPILPDVSYHRVQSYPSGQFEQQEILHIRHHSLFTPRDFDVSPYFAIIKPTLATGFDYRKLHWKPATPES